MSPPYIIILLALLQMAITFLTINHSLSFDEAIWHYIGRNWFRHGLIPYTGGIDNKSPFIYAIYGLSDLLFGVNYWFPRFIAVVCQSAGIFFLYRIAKRMAGRDAGVIALLLYGLSLVWRSTDGKMISLTQTYEITFLIISFYCCIATSTNKNFFIGGLFSGLAFWFRYSAAFGILAIFVYIIQKRKWQPGIWFFTGLLLSILLIAAVFWLSGIHLGDFITYSFTDNFSSESITDHPLAWKLEQFANAFFYSELILFYPFVLGYILLKRRIDPLITWLIASFFGVLIIGMFAHSHLKELLPPLSLMSAIFIAYCMAEYKLPVKATLIIIVIVFFPKTFEPVFALKQMLLGNRKKMTDYCQEPYLQDEGNKKKLGYWIKSNTLTEQTVFVAGFGAQVQAYSERLSPSIYFNATQTLIAKKKLIHDLSSYKPEMIVVPRFSEYTKYVDNDLRSFIDSIIGKNYAFERCLYGYSIFRTKK